MSSSDVAQVLSRLSPTQNPFTALRSFIREQLTPKHGQCVYGFYYAQSAVMAIILVMTIVGFIVRWRKRNLWFTRKATLPNGELVCPHPVNCFSLFCVPFAVIAQACIWISVRALRQAEAGNPWPWLYSLLWQLYYIPILYAVWSDMSGALTNVITAHYRLTSRVPRWLSVRFVHFWIFIVPANLTIGLISAFVVMRVRLVTLHDAWNALDGFLAIEEPSWTSGLPVAQLVALQPMGVEVQERSERFTAATRVVYIVCTVWLLLLWLVWLPCNLMQARELYRQISHLRHTANHEKRISKEEAATTATSPRHLKSIQYTSRRTAAAGPRAASSSRKQSSLEKQSRTLMRLCWQRIWSATAMTVSVAFYVFLTCWVAHDPNLAFRSPAQGNLFLVALLSGICLVGFPLQLLFLIRSFDDGSSSQFASSGASRPSASKTNAAATQEPLMIRVEIDSRVTKTKEDEEDDAFARRLMRPC